jgi:hypothetical protein
VIDRKLADLFADVGIAQEDWAEAEKLLDIIGRAIVEFGSLGEMSHYSLSYSFDCEGSNGTFHWNAFLDVDKKLFTVVTTLEPRVPQERRGEVGRYVLKANMYIPLGGFFLDQQGGEVGFSHGTYFRDIEPRIAVFANVIEKAVEAFDDYVPELLQVAFGDRDGVQAALAAHKRLTPDEE